MVLGLQVKEDYLEASIVWWRRAQALGSGQPGVESWLRWVNLGESATLGLNFLSGKLEDNNRVVVKIK